MYRNMWNNTGSERVVSVIDLSKIYHLSLHKVLVVAAAEHRRMTKYNHLSQAYQFVPVSAYGLKTAVFIKEPGKGLHRRQANREHLIQPLLAAFQSRNVMSVTGNLFIRTTFGFYPLNYLSLISAFVQ